MRIKSTQKITVVDGANGTVNVEDNIDEYVITGTETLTVNWALVTTGTPVEGMSCLIRYSANVTLGGNRITILGTSMIDEYATKDTIITARYNGASWDIDFLPDLSESNVIRGANILSDAITTVKILDQNITAAKIQAIPTGSIICGDGAGAASVKAMSQDATIDKDGKIDIQADRVTAAKVTDVVRRQALIAQVSFETNEVGDVYLYIPYKCEVQSISASVSKTVAGTDNGSVQLSSAAGIMGGSPVTITASSAVGTNFAKQVISTNNSIAADSYIKITTAKVTAGGRITIVIGVEKQD